MFVQPISVRPRPSLVRSDQQNMTHTHTHRVKPGELTHTYRTASISLKLNLVSLGSGDSACSCLWRRRGYKRFRAANKNVSVCERAHGRSSRREECVCRYETTGTFSTFHLSLSLLCCCHDNPAFIPPPGPPPAAIITSSSSRLHVSFMLPNITDRSTDGGRDMTLRTNYELTLCVCVSRSAVEHTISQPHRYHPTIMLVLKQSLKLQTATASHNAEMSS